jgi:hypothetical protein
MWAVPVRTETQMLLDESTIIDCPSTPDPTVATDVSGIVQLIVPPEFNAPYL